MAQSVRTRSLTRGREILGEKILWGLCACEKRKERIKEWKSIFGNITVHVSARFTASIVPTYQNNFSYLSLRHLCHRIWITGSFWVDEKGNYPARAPRRCNTGLENPLSPSAIHHVSFIGLGPPTKHEAQQSVRSSWVLESPSALEHDNSKAKLVWEGNWTGKQTLVSAPTRNRTKTGNHGGEIEH